jgi:hypothetical protein
MWRVVTLNRGERSFRGPRMHLLMRITLACLNKNMLPFNCGATLVYFFLFNAALVIVGDMCVHAYDEKDERG